jgi:hypothetical protein
VKADDKIRIYKDSFKEWLNSQAKHRMITEEGE